MEIIPNWHPVFVHFSIGLILVAAILHVTILLLPESLVKSQMAVVARWNLWMGAVFVVFTVAAGFLAYNSVDHDTPSHLAMTTHKNWALATSAVILITAIWSFIIHKKSEVLPIAATILVLISSGLLASTAWRGGELVYRYGLGVMSLPKADSHGHSEGNAHSHGGEASSGDDHAHSDDHGHSESSDHENSTAEGKNSETEHMHLDKHESSGQEGDHTHVESHSHEDISGDKSTHEDSHKDGHSHEGSNNHEDNHSH